MRARVLLALGWLAVILYGYPGMMTMDSIQQLQEARASFYTDAHPPVMAWVWHFVDEVVAGPLGMFVVQTTLVVVGLYLFLRRALSPTAAAIATSIVVVYPPVLAPLGVIWKDCWMAGMLALGAAGLASERRSAKLWGLAALVVATAVRYNAPAATLPLIVLLFTWTWQRGIKRYALAVAVWLGVTAVALGWGALVTDRPMHFWHSTLALMDTAGTLANLDTTRPDDEMRTLTAGTGLRVDHDIHDAIRRRYSPLDFDPLIRGDGHLWDMPISGTEPAPVERRDAIARMFETTVTGNVGAYLAHRATVMRYVLALYDGPAFSPVMTHRAQYKDLLAALLHLEVHPTRFQLRWERRFVALAGSTPLFRPWLYAALALLLLGFCRSHRDIAALLLSGLGLEASLFLLAPTPDYRYSHWLVISTCIAVIMLVARRARSV